MGDGVDIGPARPEWALPGARIVKPYRAADFHYEDLDFVFSSHLLGNLPGGLNWVVALDYWVGKLKPGGQLFLYLPHSDYGYWGRYCVHPDNLMDYFEQHPDIARHFVSGRDLNYSYVGLAEKL